MNGMAEKRRKIRFSIANKLALCFTAAILVLTVVIASVFTVLFRNYSKDVYRDNMKKTASSIASVMTSVIRDGGGSLWDAFIENEIFGNPGYSERIDGKNVVYLDGPMLIRFVKEITDADVWLIDSSLNILTTSQDSKTEYSSQYSFSTLPYSAQKFIAKIFEDQGYEVYGENFSEVLKVEIMTVGRPVYSPSGQVIGAVLLHTPVKGMLQTINQGLLILLVSLACALLIGTVLSVFLSHNIVRPLTKINHTALLLSEGDYTAHTNVNRRDEIGELAHTMDEMGDKLRKAEEESEKLQKMRQDFVANISHELRTPVTVIRGSLEALCDGVVTKPDMVEEYHRQLLGESIYMQRLVNDLLDLSRLQNPDFSINISEFNLYDCISDAVRSGHKIAQEKGLSIDFQYDATLYLMKGDYDRVRQMLLIIIDNAVKFTDQPSHPIRIALEGNTVSITNTGPGIKREDLPLIFERFYKSRSEKNKNGTGLGLAIAKQIASRHNIGISVSSIEGGQTTFRFVFPDKI